MATFQTRSYPVHPSYASYSYPTTPPPAAGSYAYFSPRNYSYTTSAPSKGHTRRATGDGTTYTYTYTNTTPSKPTHYNTPEHAYFSSAHSTPRKSDYVSGSARTRDSKNTSRKDSAKQRKYSTASTKQYSSSRKQHVPVDDYDSYDRSFEYLPRYEKEEPRPPPYNNTKHHQPQHYSTYYYEPRTDHRSRDQVPIYTSTDSKARPRRASYTTKPAQQQQQPPRRPTTASSPPPKATEADARKAGIPAGYSYKNWDPTEEPILLLGSVFDANSLGKWIYDWTVFFFGPATPMSEVAGDLWLLLIQLAHKIKRAEDIMPRIRSTKNHDMVDEFLDSGERLWQRFNKLLKICENYMWKAAKKESGNAKNVTMGKNSGCEFVDAIFGRDRELDRTEKLMAGIRLWSMRFDANCEDILRNPTK